MPSIFCSFILQASFPKKTIECQVHRNMDLHPGSTHHIHRCWPCHPLSPNRQAMIRSWSGLPLVGQNMRAQHTNSYLPKKQVKKLQLLRFDAKDRTKCKEHLKQLIFMLHCCFIHFLRWPAQCVQIAIRLANDFFSVKALTSTDGIEVSQKHRNAWGIRQVED